MANESAPTRSGFEEFRHEFAETWANLPFKGLFLVLLVAWIALFHFVGNSTLGYTNTASIFGWLDWVVKQTGDDQHVPFVLAGVLALLWWKRKELRELPKQNWWPALAVVGVGILIHALGYMVQQARISLVGFFVGIYGLVGVVWGPQMLRATFFPMFLFAFCMPLGGTLANSMTLPLRIVATKITTVVCHGLFGINVVQDGTRLFDANMTYSYEVAVACSGIRSLTATLALALVYAFVMFKTTWRRLAMVVATVPLAIAANVVRLTTIIITSEAFGQAAGNYVHESWWASLLPYIPMIGGIFLIGHWLREKRVSEPGRESAARWTNGELAVVLGAAIAIFVLRDALPGIKAWTFNHQYTSASLLVAAAVAALRFISSKPDGTGQAIAAQAATRIASRWSVGTTAAALVLIAVTAGALQYRQGHQKLGVPGVKVVQKEIYDPEGHVVGSNSVALPDRVLNFKSETVPVERVVLEWLPKDTTYGQRLYKAEDGFQSQMNVVLMGSDRTSIHKPQYCLTGTGWQIDQTELDTIPIDRPRSYQLPVNKLTVSRTVQGPDGSKVTVHGVYVYWFVAENRLTAHHGQRMIEMGIDMLRTGVLQRWAYVSCFSMCYPGQEQATYGRVKELITAAVPAFQLTTGDAATLARNP